MKKLVLSIWSAIIALIIWNCSSIATASDVFSLPATDTKSIVQTGLDVLLDDHSYKLYGKSIALVTNQSGIDRNGISNIERMLENDSINVKIIFSPEHGFDGKFSAGEHIGDQTFKYFPPIKSLYGKNRKPTQDMLENIDLIIYDIQDVGARFYTYISTLGLVMEAAAEAGIQVMVLDRPNLIGNRIAGPILDENYNSFIGKYPISIQYGMTIGELAQMIAGEKMINSVPVIEIIPMENYHSYLYYDNTVLPWVKPSPNIPDLETAIIYPGLCLIEGTNVSEGRGTQSPFKKIGAPWINADKLTELLNRQELPGVRFTPSQFIPVSIDSMSKYPKFEGKECFGIDIKVTNRNEFRSILTGVSVIWAINKLYPDSLKFRERAIILLWGSDKLYNQLLEGKTPAEIIESYQSELEQFKLIRQEYLIY